MTRIAVIIPCYNEAVAIASVVQDFHNALPNSEIYVYDNNSTDATASRAAEAGAKVFAEPRQGKGHVVRRMFRDIEADWYIMVDGDATYDAAIAPEMLRLAMQGPHDLVNCIRKEAELSAYREGHRLGNQLLTGAVRFIFGDQVQDMLSGYKVFSRRFVKSFPVLSAGFDIETELTIHALELAMPVAHVPGVYRGRPPGSHSKLRTYRDGWRILQLILRMHRHERPLLFFSSIAVVLASVSMALGAPIILHYLSTGLVPRFPTAFLALGIMVLAVLSLTTGIVLDTVTRGRREMRMLAYLQIPVEASPAGAIAAIPTAPEGPHVLE